MTQSEFEKALEVLFHQRMSTVRSEMISVIKRVTGASDVVGAKPHPRSPTSPGPRRSPEEVQALGKRLFAEISKRPGSTMMELVGELDASSREMERPMAWLKRTGRVRATGQRNFTRYFPMNPSSSSEGDEGGGVAAE